MKFLAFVDKHSIVLADIPARLGDCARHKRKEFGFRKIIGTGQEQVVFLPHPRFEADSLAPSMEVKPCDSVNGTVTWVRVPDSQVAQIVQDGYVEGHNENVEAFHCELCGTSREDDGLPRARRPLDAAITSRGSGRCVGSLIGI